MSQETAWYGGKIQRVYKAFTVVQKMKRFLLIYQNICLNRTEKVGLAKDWWDMSQETAWYRGEKPFPNSHVKYILIIQPKIFITFHNSLSQNKNTIIYWVFSKNVYD